MVVQESVRVDAEETIIKDNKKHRLKQRFDVRQKLGQGTYGKVQLAVNRESGQEVAIKTIKKSKIESEQDLLRIRREIQIMSSIQHPHIIHIYEVFENKDKIVLVMQFASGGELYNYLSEKKVLSDVEARRIFRQIAAAVYYCHKNKICHRDLKLENILLDEKGNAKIADFGLSNVFDERHLLKTYCGSPLYASPEIVKGVPYYGPEVDCWSMGVLLYTLVYGAMPFGGSNFKKLVTQISEGDYFEPKKKSKASDLIHKLLAVNPLKRATIVDICTDFWVNQGFEHSLLQVAEDMANLTPVRLDLLLALAPGSPMPVPEEDFKEGSDSEPQPDKSDVDNEDEDDNPETTANNSFAFMHGSQVNNLSASSPNLQNAASVRDDEEDTEEEFLPADIAAALELQCAKRGAENSFDRSLLHVSSVAHKSKKPRKSNSTVKSMTEAKDSTCKHSENDKVKATKPDAEEIEKFVKHQDVKESTLPHKPQFQNVSATEKDTKEQVEKPAENKVISKAALKTQISETRKPSISEEKEKAASVPINLSEKIDEVSKKQEQDKIGVQTRRLGRPPGKIVIPKTFDSPQSTPSPKVLPVRVASSSVSSQGSVEEKHLEASANLDKPFSKVIDSPTLPSVEKEESVQNELQQEISPEKKMIAKGILKKGIAKAKLAERKLSQQDSFDSEIATPTSSVKSPEMIPSFFKAPKPYKKEEDTQQMKSKAEITLAPPNKLSEHAKTTNEVLSAPLWDSVSIGSQPRHVDNQNSSWGALSTLDSEMCNWREQMEESLKRLSPDSEIGTVATVNEGIQGAEDDKNLVPIARSYKKFTFTKDGACITETKKIYTAPCPDGSWTKVEKKTKITTRPGNIEEFEKFRGLHLRNERNERIEVPITKSDSQSSSGSNDVYDDIFDSWTGDSMMCNMVKIRDVFQKFSQDPFLRSEGKRNPFRNFRRTESDRHDRCVRKELRSAQSTDKDSDNDDETPVESSNPVVYGSQGLWQFLKSSNQRLPRNVVVSPPEHYSRSISQDRTESKLGHWKHCESRISSGYNTGSRSQSRDRTQSPHEKVLRFVFESNPSSRSPPKRDSLYFRRTASRHEPRRDSGINSDGYESEHSYRRIPSDDLLKPRASPVSAIYSSRPGIIRDFVKPRSKETMSPSSFRHDMMSDVTDNRKHKVEEWLNMNTANDSKFFSLHNEPYTRMAAARKSSMHDNLSSTYATMRPREYPRYNIRSSNDKVDNTDYFSSPEPRSVLMRNSQNKDSEQLKSRTRASTYSPLSEESNRSHLHHSDSSHSASSTHHINFTFSDGRVSTSQGSSPMSLTRRSDGFSTYCADPGSNRCYGQPMVQMKVSFNRGNAAADNRMIHITPSPPVGLWQQQQDNFNNSSRHSSGDGSCSINREISPEPGIKKFSTEMVHTVEGSAEDGSSNSKDNTNTLEFEVKATVQNSAHTTPKGKVQLTRNHDGHRFVCTSPCMKSPMNNINQSPGLQTPHLIVSCKNEAFPQNSNFAELANNLNTPDSLEDAFCDFNVDYEISSLTEKCATKDKDATYTSDLPLLKPVGVLWDNYSPKSLQETRNSSKGTCSPWEETYNSAPENFTSSSPIDANERKERSRRNSYHEVGSIWQQQKSADDNQNNSFDFLKDLLDDDALDNFNSIREFAESTNVSENNNLVTKDSANLRSPLSVLKEFTFLEDYEVDVDADCKKFRKLMPSLLDDLQSPQQVLHQALRISNTLKSCE